MSVSFKKLNVKNRGFTLVELLAVIVILAIILVIAVPQITETIEKSKKSSFETSVKLIISSAETEYLTKQALGESTEDIQCSDVTDIDTNEYESCNITFNEKGEATVVVVEGECPNIVEQIEELYNKAASTNGLEKNDTKDENIRYVESNPNNYVEFGSAGELW